ncbi:MAG: hypothetical protein JKP92_01735 [Alphaproteobacteria bacterium]|jgi:hypothetical protein|nr:hypothetical protein [Alphaproteobacteria bacterium]
MAAVLALGAAVAISTSCVLSNPAQAPVQEVASGTRVNVDHFGAWLLAGMGILWIFGAASGVREADDRRSALARLDAGP